MIFFAHTLSGPPLHQSFSIIQVACIFNTHGLFSRTTGGPLTPLDPPWPSSTLLASAQLSSGNHHIHICQPLKTWQPNIEPLEWVAIKCQLISIRVDQQHRPRLPFISLHAAGSWEGAERFRPRRRLHWFPAVKHLNCWRKQWILLQINTLKYLSSENEWSWKALMSSTAASHTGGVLVYLRCLWILHFPKQWSFNSFVKAIKQ